MTNHPSDPVTDLLAQLTPAQQRAVAILRLSLACYNTRDGVGELSGPGRYTALARRCRLAAAQARDLPGFWAILCRRMRWPVPPKAVDQELLALLQGDAHDVLRVLAAETVSIVQIARFLHDQDKGARRALIEEELQPATEAVPTTTTTDLFGGIA